MIQFVLDVLAAIFGGEVTQGDANEDAEDRAEYW
jgi:hypothetical protein